MIFGWPIAAGTLATFAAIAAGLTILAYVLKMRRRRVEVPFSKLWDRVLNERDSSSLFRRLRRFLSLLVQLAFLALLFGAALDPRWGTEAPDASHVVLIVDASASMQAQDRGPSAPTRLARAREAAGDLLGRMGGSDHVMLLRMDSQATALSRFEADKTDLRRRLAKLEASDTSADLGAALSAAADALRGRKNPTIVLIGDASYAESVRGRVVWDREPTLAEIDLRGIDVRFVSIGVPATNVGITSFNVRRYPSNKLSYEALVELQSFSLTPLDVKLTIMAGTNPIFARTMTLAPGERQRIVSADLGGGEGQVLEASLAIDGDDALAIDDRAWALLPARKPQKVLLVSQDNLYLEGALLLDEHVTVDKLRPAAYAQDESRGAAYDVVVLDDAGPVPLPASRGVLLFRPAPETSPLRVSGTLERPLITTTAENHPVTRWVSLSDVNIDNSQTFALEPSDAGLALSLRAAIVSAGTRDGQRIVAFGFGLGGTDLQLRAGFPILMVNILDWFAGNDSDLMTTYRTGEPWLVPLDVPPTVTQIDVRSPRGNFPAPVLGGVARFLGRRAGLYELVAPERTFALAANLASPMESDLRIAGELSLGGRALPPPIESIAVPSRQIWHALVLAALLLLVIESLTYHRRITL